MLQKLAEKANANPRSLLFVDGIGALLSALLLGFVLVRFESFFGMPGEMLYWLAFWPCLFALYDFASVLTTSPNYTRLLKIIALANLAYCFLSIGALIYHAQTITIWGLWYFVSELLIVFSLVIIELKTSAQLSIAKS